MMESSQPQVIVRRRRGRRAHGRHHGGAWKVAYADFVTAMMAFFLLLWILNTTDDAQKAGLSEYFQAPSETASGRVAGAGAGPGAGASGGPHSPAGPTQRGDRAPPEGAAPPQVAGPAADRVTPPAGSAGQGSGPPSSVSDESARLEALRVRVGELIEADPALRPYREQLLVDVTDEGLRIQVIDRENRLMFDAGSARLKPYTRDILEALGRTINTVPNRVSLTGHTDASPYGGDGRYGNWELSADRANASRRALVDGGLAADKVARVVGLADQVPFRPDAPLDPINRRISLIVMNQAAEQAMAGGLGRPASASPGSDAAAVTAPAGDGAVDPVDRGPDVPDRPAQSADGSAEAGRGAGQASGGIEPTGAGESVAQPPARQRQTAGER